jgi:hypothetical protein
MGGSKWAGGYTILRFAVRSGDLLTARADPYNPNLAAKHVLYTDASVVA